MKTGSQHRQDQIIKAAVKRFSHFGIAKTSLTEVAEDLALSKQALSYYFPDKQSLVNVVVEKISDDYISQLSMEINESESVETALLKITQVKARFFERYFMFANHDEYVDILKLESFTTWRKRLSERESALLTRLFERGISQDELKPLHARNTAELLLETLFAFSKCMKDRGGIPEPAAFRELLNKQQEVIKLFYQGLKANTPLN